MRRFAVTALFLVGCASGCAARTEVESPATTAEPILTPPPQRSASAYQEAVTIFVNNGDSDFCTGVIIAPRVVLTAAHCVSFNPDDGTHGTWSVVAPFAPGGAQSRTASNGEPYNPDFYTLSVTSYDANDGAYHDLALLYMDTAFTGITLPTLSATQYPTVANQQVSAVGRASVSANAGLVLSKAVTLSATVPSDGYPNDTKTPRITDGGDSGGPLYLEGTHTLVGLESRFDPGRVLDYWVRLDGEVFTFLQAAIAAHGGATRDPVADFVYEVGAVLCGRAAGCCKAGNASYVLSPTTCRETYAQYGFESTARDLLSANHAKLSIVAAKRSACIASIGDTTKCTVTSTVKTDLANCIAAVSGTVAAGGACTKTVECTEGVCVGGTCHALEAVNQSCEIADKSGTVDERYDQAQDLCTKRGGGTPATYCDGYDFVGNAYKAEAAWTCQPAKANGASCGTNPECTSAICAPYGAANQFTCVASTSFATPAVCSAFQ